MAENRNEISGEQVLFNELPQLIEQSRQKVAAEFNSSSYRLFLKTVTNT